MPPVNDLRIYLYAHRIKRAEVAKTLGVSVGTAANKIHGRTPITVEEAQELHDKFNVPISLFLHE
ncbi:helix-turn-helix domain-containing protein [Furfurilactobacillus curtus]|uniref:HTH cro/C1-type domain-containing protein n=1 Tax=Furfurilactobacillus curtus TaxID=1746200 RepID=A0ABQ5JQN2_9LACO